MFDNSVSSLDLKNIDKFERELKHKVITDFVIYFLNGKVKIDDVKKAIYHKPKIKTRCIKVREDYPNKDILNKCMACVWKGEKMQCRNFRKDYSEYCSIHLDNRNYGRIDD